MYFTLSPAFEAAKKATLPSAALKQKKTLKDQHSKQPFSLSLPFIDKTTQIPDLADLTYAFKDKAVLFILMLMFKGSPGNWCPLLGIQCVCVCVCRQVVGRVDSVERLLVDPHQGPRLVGFAFVLDAAELVAELAVLPLVVVVVFRLPHRLKGPGLVKLDRETRG